MTPMKRYPRLLGAVALALLVLSLTASTVVAQGGSLAQQSLGRPYWHVFAAYGIAWALMFGWLVSMARRLRRVEERIGKE